MKKRKMILSSLNLGKQVVLVLYEALRQINISGMTRRC